MRRLLAIPLILLLVVLTAQAQHDTTNVTTGRHITPVRPSTNTVLQPGRDVSPEIIEQYITGDTVSARAQARKDSLRRVYPRYPRLTSLWLGANFADPILMALGQDHANIDLHATLNMWNRLQPTLELGLGWARTRPDGLNFTYRAKPSPYAKVGANYNFLFKGKPDYQAFVGLRLGASTFAYDVEATYANSYWREQIDIALTNQRSHAVWGEVVAGLKVAIYHRWALGWTVRWHHLFNYKKTDSGRPWFIPGYGPRSRALTFTVSAYYTLPLSTTSWPQTSDNLADR